MSRLAVLSGPSRSRLAAGFAALTLAAGASADPALTASTYYGGAGEHAGRALSVQGGAAYVAGWQGDGLGNDDGLIARWSLPLSNNAVPVWDRSWPGIANWDVFFGISQISDGLYVAGPSYGRTSDTVGSKEVKGLVVRFDATDPNGGAGYGGAMWDQQTPPAPGAFTYGGTEQLFAVTTNLESSVVYVYATGTGQQNGSNGGRMFLSKLSALGALQWTQTDAGEMVSNRYSSGQAVMVAGGAVYVAGRDDDDGTMRPSLRKYDTVGTFAWARTSDGGFGCTARTGQAWGIAASGSDIYIVGHTGPGDVTSDFFIEKWTDAGNCTWSRTFDRNATEDMLRGVTTLGGYVYASGWTFGNTSGGADAVVLKIDPANGDLLATTLHGGASDDKAYAIATDGSVLLVTGETASFGGGGRDVMLLSFSETYLLTVNKAGTGGGTVTSDVAGINCGADCTETYVSGTLVTLTATPDSTATFTGWSGGGCSGTGTCQVTMSAAATVTATFDQASLVLVGSTYFGGAGEQAGRGVAIAGTAAFVGGRSGIPGDEDALVARWNLPLANAAAPAWSKVWPAAPGHDLFESVAASGEGVYLAGRSYPRTSDTVGGKEIKGLAFKLDPANPDGGPGFNGVVWERQTPAPPGAFGYGGGEYLNAVATNVEAAQVHAYATGVGQQNGGNGGRMYLSKLDSAGNVQWTVTDAAEMVLDRYSSGHAVAAAGGAIYVAGRDDDDGTARLSLRRYDTGGVLAWARTSDGTFGCTARNGYAWGLAVSGSDIYLVGHTGPGDATSDFIIEKWTDAGNCTWSRTFDRNSSEDVLRGVATFGGFVYAAGWTFGNTSGGADAVVLKIDPANGDLLATTLHGGASDDKAYGIASDGSVLLVTGETASFGGGAIDVMLLSMIPPGNTYALDVAKGGTGSGTVTSLPAGIDCGADCTQTYVDGVAVTLAATADATSTFTGWSGEGCSGTGTCVVAMTATRYVTANFAINTYTLTVNKAGAGSGGVASDPAGINCGADCSETYAHGTPITLTAAATGSSTFAGWSGEGCTGTGTCQVTMTAARSVTATFDQASLVLAASTYFGGAGEHAGRAVSVSGTAAFVGGRQGIPGDEDALAARWNLPLANGAAPAWSKVWPAAPGHDLFESIAATGEGVYLAGRSYPRTSDTVGGKEIKGLAFKLDPVDPNGGAGFGGAVWERQTPAAPGAFAYGGGEYLNAVAGNVESAQVYVYATGTGQQNGTNGGRMYLSKLDSAGNIQWTITDAAEMASNRYSSGNAVTAAGGAIYVAGRDDDDGTMRPSLRRYGTGSALDWARTSDGTFGCTARSGQAWGIAVSGSDVYIAGHTGPGDATSDFFIEKWSDTGNCAWSRTFDRGSSEDILRGVTTFGGFVYAAGWTFGNTAGGADAVVLKIDPANGDLLATTLHGGAQDDRAFGIATDGAVLLVAGETASFGGGGLDVTLLAYTPPGDMLTLSVSKDGTGTGTVTSLPAGISCDADCSETYASGVMVTLTASPAGGSTFAGWSGGGCSGTGTCQVTMSAAASVTATFTLETFTLTVSKAGAGSGTVTSVPAGINCGADCSEGYDSGTLVTLTATPAGGSTFAGWSGGGCSGTGTCQVTMSTAHTVTATFSPPAGAPPRSGFNGDARSDVFWRNTTGGQNYQWQMNGLAISGQGYMPSVPSNWAVAAIGDANGDGRADVLWREAGGLNYLWLVNGLTLSGQGYLPTVANPWAVVGMGDANGDSRADVFWRNSTTGQNYLWILNGLAITSQGYLPSVAGSDWEVKAVADLTGDGKADVLWRNKTTGQNYLWIVNGLVVASQGYLPSVLPVDWEIVGAPDANGDGRADVLWRHKITGQNYLWLMNGLSVTSQGYLPSVADANWKVVGYGDYNGDGRGDVLWRNATTGQNYLWTLNGISVASQGYLPSVSGANWTPIP